MKFFVLFVTADDNRTYEFYLKGNSSNHLEETIKKYSNGAIVTSEWILHTSKVKSGFLREIELWEYPNLTEQDFLEINDKKSYVLFDFREWKNWDFPKD